MNFILILICIFSINFVFPSNAQLSPKNNITWSLAGSLPPAKGEKENIGLAGMLYGKDNGYIIVGGGANFPDKNPAFGGTKKLYQDIYVYKLENNNLILTDQMQMDLPIAYGVSVNSPDGLYYLGGNISKSIFLFNVDNKGKLKIKKITSLPFTFQNGIACYHNGYIYFGLGKQNGKVSKNFYRYNIKTNQFENLKPIPKGFREQSIAQLLDNKICVFSGGSNIAYTDGYGYNLKTKNWEKLSSVKYKGNKISLLGASCVKLNDNEMLVIGGFNKEIYDWAVKNLSTLKNEELSTFKKVYFSSSTKFFQWNKKILVYNAKSNQWSSLGNLPFPAPCGEALILEKNKLICINGEIKPAVRSNSIYIGTIKIKE